MSETISDHDLRPLVHARSWAERGIANRGDTALMHFAVHRLTTAAEADTFESDAVGAAAQSFRVAVGREAEAHRESDAAQQAARLEAARDDAAQQLDSCRRAAVAAEVEFRAAVVQGDTAAGDAADARCREARSEGDATARRHQLLSDAAQTARKAADAEWRTRLGRFLPAQAAAARADRDRISAELAELVAGRLIDVARANELVTLLVPPDPETMNRRDLIVEDAL